MQLKQVISSVKNNRATSMLVILQVALILMIVSNAVFHTLASLELWSQPSSLAENRLVSIRQQVFDPNLDVAMMIQDDHIRLNQIEGVVGNLLVSEIPLDNPRDKIQSVYLDNGELAKANLIERFDSSEKLLGMIDAKLLEGRNFEPSEIITGEIGQVNSYVPVVMVSDALAKTLFSEQSALGKTIWMSKGRSPAKIVGVYSDFLAGEALENYHTIITPLMLWSKDSQINYLLKTNMDVTQTLLDNITNSLYQTQGRYVSVVEALARPKKRMYDGRGSYAFTLLGISVLAMLITALGVSGLISFTVNQRKKQIGIRRALGGSKQQIINFFVLEISLLTVLGLVLGLLLMVTLSYILADQSGDLSNIQLWPLLLLTIVIWCINLISAWFPAKQAAQIDPAIVTRGT